MDFLNIKTDNQINELTILASEIWHEYWPCLLTTEQINYMVNLFQSYEAVKSAIENKGYIYKIIRYNGENAGYFGVCSEDNKLFLSKLYVKKDYRHCGIGKSAFEHILEIARTLNKQIIYLTVNKNNKTAICAYLKWGFKNVKSVVTDIGCGFVMDDYIMEYNLQEN